MLRNRSFLFGQYLVRGLFDYVKHASYESLFKHGSVSVDRTIEPACGADDFSPRHIQPGAVARSDELRTLASSHQGASDFTHQLGGFVLKHGWTRLDGVRNHMRMTRSVVEKGGVTKGHFSLQREKWTVTPQDGSDPVRVDEG
ncbi:MAG: hypothetical protein CVU22_14940 [Betaproteobacteria bacterium HGW-Betaproteobacteria-16]|nr:MAG: hypothetical protein CVU22_14940 [Betaproteobacteria bacterium HGW-Betaproteobacteria-16]